MFYYLHLTRPPPEQANPSQPITVTPNIANDLRTKHPSPGPNGIDIYYAWVRCIEQIAGSGETAAKGHGLGPMTQPQKLTTWTGNSYREVHVFPPKEALQLQSSEGRWQLLLCTRAADRSTYVTSIDLSSQSFGKVIFPILSAPVRFLASARNIGKPREAMTERKQVHNERVFKLPSNGLWKSPFAGPLRVVEHLSYDLDKKVWDSGVGLSHWLAANMFIALKEDSDSKGDIPSVVRNLIHLKGATILELGTGTGLVSIVLAALLSNCPESRRSRIIATDLPSAMETLEANLSDNGQRYPSIQAQAEPVVLDWDDEKLPPEIMRNGGGVLDFIIMADVIYNTASFSALVGTLSRLSRLRRDASGGPTVLLAYKERDPDERRLWDMAREIGLHFAEIARVPGIGSIPVEIHLGTFEYGEDK